MLYICTKRICISGDACYGDIDFLTNKGEIVVVTGHATCKCKSTKHTTVIELIDSRGRKLSSHGTEKDLMPWFDKI